MGWSAGKSVADGEAKRDVGLGLGPASGPWGSGGIVAGEGGVARVIGVMARFSVRVWERLARRRDQWRVEWGSQVRGPEMVRVMRGFIVVVEVSDCAGLADVVESWWGIVKKDFLVRLDRSTVVRQ